MDSTFQIVEASEVDIPAIISLLAELSVVTGIGRDIEPETGMENLRLLMQSPSSH